MSLSNLICEMEKGLDKIKSIFENKSKTDSDKSKTDSDGKEFSAEEFSLKFIEMLKSDVSEEKAITYFKEVITELIKKLDMSPLFDGFEDYVREYSTTITTTKPCTKFTNNVENLNIDDNSTEIQAVMFLRMMECANCRHIKEKHVVCKKFVGGRFFDCTNCGLTCYYHQTCVDFQSGERECCTNCGKDLFDHQQKLKEDNKHHCGKFCPVPGAARKCTNCIFEFTDHCMSEEYNKLKDKALSEVSDESLKFNVDMNMASQILQRDTKQLRAASLLDGVVLLNKLEALKNAAEKIRSLKNTYDELMYVPEYDTLILTQM